MDRSRLSEERGQAAVEFVFAFLGMLLIMMFMVTMFMFAQDVFQTLSQTRYDLLEEYRETPQFRVTGDRRIGSTGVDIKIWEEEFEVRLRLFPFMDRFISGIDPWERKVLIGGGADPDYPLSPELQCAGGTALLAALTGTSDVPGVGLGAPAALGACAARDF